MGRDFLWAPGVAIGLDAVGLLGLQQRDELRPADSVVVGPGRTDAAVRARW
jgi:hypothetical protein